MRDSPDSKVRSIQVTAPHFSAGIFVEDGHCIAAAPALEWALGKSVKELNAYFKRRHWQAAVRVAPPPPAEPDDSDEYEEESQDDEAAKANDTPRQLLLGI
jgi:hypothetical protein